MLQEKRREATMRVIGDKIRTFTRVEKAFYSSIVLSGLALAIGIIFMQTRLLQLQSSMVKSIKTLAKNRLKLTMQSKLSMN